MENPEPGDGYAALTESVGTWTDPGRVIIRIGGPRADRMLNGLLSTDITLLQPGDAALSFVLTSKGRPVAVPKVIRTQDAILLDVSRASLPGLLDHFGTYLPPRFATVTVLEGARRISLLGPRSEGVAAEVATASGCLFIPRDLSDGGGVDVYMLSDEDRSAVAVIEAAISAAGGLSASAADYDTWRIERGIPVFGVDITADNLPQETGLVERAVSFDKGCFTGQEVVARIHYRGHVNRHLRGLRSTDPSTRPCLQPDEAVYSKGRVVGAVTSSCDSPRFGPICLAYVRREVAPGDEIGVSPDAHTGWLVSGLPFTSP
jgi:folate-binding protein YgfZ